ncbi:MAG: hypothetical protein HUK14_04170 [Muribaculaceae bacterium]|nr:hypothetical protein [Muribaculaceae bacterium]
MKRLLSTAFVTIALCIGLTTIVAQEPQFAPPAVNVADDVVYGPSEDDLDMQMKGYLYDLTLLKMEVPVANKARLENILASLKRINAKFDILMQSNQDLVAADSALMEIMSQYREQSADIEQYINTQITNRDNSVQFAEIEKYFKGQDSIYSKYKDQATALSLVQQTAKQLAALKKDELLTRQEMDAKYAAASSIAEQSPLLKERMETIRASYNDLAAISDEVQATEYKPFLARIKDYLMSFAAVAVILMFVGLLTTKIKAAKDLRKQAKKLKQLERQQNNDYPSI